MLEDFLKDKKKTGICVLIAIVIIASGFIYYSSGYKDLKKNDTESIFVEDENTETSSNHNNLVSTGEEIQSKASINKNEIKEKEITVEIKGEVKKPDVYILKENSIVKDLINEAGGLTENADISNINRAKQLQNHELVYIGNKNEASQNIVSSNVVPNNSNSNTKNMININSATEDELKTLKGIGDSKAKSIIEYRNNNGNFNNIEDIKNVDGIGEKMFEKIKDSITV